MTVLDVAEQVLVSARLGRAVGHLEEAHRELAAAAKGCPSPVGGVKLGPLADRAGNVLALARQAADATAQPVGGTSL